MSSEPPAKLELVLSLVEGSKNTTPPQPWYVSQIPKKISGKPIEFTLSIIEVKKTTSIHTPTIEVASLVLAQVVSRGLVEFILRLSKLRPIFQVGHGTCPRDPPEVASLREELKVEYRYKVLDISLEYFVEQILSVCPEEYQKPFLDFKDRYLRF